MFKPYGALKVRGYITPVVVIEEVALQKMRLYVEEVSDEVGWLGTVERVGNTFYITDTYLFEQEVHGATCEISPDSIATLAEQFLSEPDGLEKANSIRMWGHSHVNMGVMPSAQDEKQFEELSNNSEDYFIRIIANKKMDLRVDLVDLTTGLEYSEVQWQRNEEELIDREAIKAEIKSKVKKFAPVTPIYSKTPANKPMYGQQSYGYGYDSYSDYEDDWNRGYYANTYHTPNKKTTEPIVKGFEQELLECETVMALEEFGIELQEMYEIANMTTYEVQTHLNSTFVNADVSFTTAKYVQELCVSKQAYIEQLLALEGK